MNTAYTGGGLVVMLRRHEFPHTNETWRRLVRKTFHAVLRWRKLGLMKDEEMRFFLGDLWEHRNLAEAGEAMVGPFSMGYCWGRLDARAH